FIFADPKGVDIVTPRPEDPFAVPALDPDAFRTPREVMRMDRRSVTGEVLATWGLKHVMLRANERIINLTLAAGATLPPCGVTITAAGYPETDLYRLNLTKAVWKNVAGSPVADETPADVTAANILAYKKENPSIDSQSHGRLIRLRGRVLSLPGEGDTERRFLLDSDGHRVPIDLSSVPSAAANISVGCTVEVTGRCLLETESWRPYDVFPQIRGFSVVVRTPADIRILTRPPWWTPARLLIVIAALFAALLAFFVWNRVLNRIVERRGRALFRAEIASAAAELRTDERTRLAVELHDTISQNLTGASMRIDAARRVLDTDRDKTLRNLDVVSRTLTSCREELRNCIWDLRNQSLEEKDLADAIRQTLDRHSEDAKISVRFSVPRARLTDKTAHALLQIIRELTVNAIRHGGAKSVRIAGAIEDGRLLFSVTDDGCGFDPDAHPGVSEGHFGLNGVAERIRKFNGTMTIDSARGKGTRIAVAFKLPNAGQGTNNG
ncbi:MAG: hypothetical protein IKJ89_07735, partial [Kiritimatiellae bacterium]|nr:hypothetical protein [Kiritimatiellia bacterium]